MVDGVLILMPHDGGPTAALIACPAWVTGHPHDKEAVRKGCCWICGKPVMLNGVDWDVEVVDEGDICGSMLASGACGVVLRDVVVLDDTLLICLRVVGTVFGAGSGGAAHDASSRAEVVCRGRADVDGGGGVDVEDNEVDAGLGGAISTLMMRIWSASTSPGILSRCLMFSSEASLSHKKHASA
eukprot:6489334-Amphidinium_carterae.1